MLDQFRAVGDQTWPEEGTDLTEIGITGTMSIKPGMTSTHNWADSDKTLGHPRHDIFGSEGFMRADYLARSVPFYCAPFF